MSPTSDKNNVLVIIFSGVISLILFISSFFWFNAWQYGVLCIFALALVLICLRVKFDNWFEKDSSYIKFLSGIFLFIIVLGIIGIAIVTYSFIGSGEGIRMKPD